ncbi:Uncharacterized protein BM_BM161 [Brugia malayi]|uniref:Bm161 n=2 Tax=Brugia TaxID=6278 RepID=A0A1P6BP19_BRUMA|nr:Uncharacterized protein BM_BM161 [Brugia malayi]CDP91324.1 Bm161 [Brugia malayi]VDO13964.1 unnamed protein product [Brugia timori]VIO89709.1 Uncharacterized protein BM_BM161 [Brugia malayi]
MQSKHCHLANLFPFDRTEIFEKMVQCCKWIVHLLIAFNLLICLEEANATEIRESEIYRPRFKRQFFGFSIGPFGWFQGGGRYGRKYGFNRFLSPRPLVARRFWRRRFGRIGDRWWW